MDLQRSDMKARTEMFDRFALKDQKNYYKSAIRNNRMSASQVNRYRALFAFLTGLAAALAGLIVQSSFVGGATCTGDSIPASCDSLKFLVSTLTILAVVLPAIGGAFSTLADLYQWDKLIQIYETAAANMEDADALSPKEQMEDDTIYRASMKAFAEGTLQVMTDETTQWGQSVRRPKQLEEFIKEEKDRVDSVVRSVTGQTYDEGQGANRPIPFDDDDEPDSTPT